MQLWKFQDIGTTLYYLVGRLFIYIAERNIATQNLEFQQKENPWERDEEKNFNMFW